MLATLLAVGCGDGTKVVSGSGSSPVEGIYGFIRGIVSDFSVTDADMAAIVVSGCAAYAEGVDQEDSFTFNGYVEDLLATSEGGRNEAVVDGAIAGACASFEGDVHRFVDDLSGSLALGLDELQALMATACAAFEEHRPSPDETGAPETYDPVVTSVLAAGGMQRSELDDLVTAACKDLPEPTTTEPPIPEPVETRNTVYVTTTTAP